jgi:hypothetical protein
MSDVAVPSANLPTGTPYFEHRIFEWSPFGVGTTAALLFALLYGAFLLIAALAGMSAMPWTGHGFEFHNGAWPALVLSLLIATALGTQRYTRLRDAADRMRFASIFSGGADTAERLSAYAPAQTNLRRATLAGIVLGLAASAAILAGQKDARLIHPAVMAWFVVAITLSAVLFTRGVELTRKFSASFATMLRDELDIDLLRVDHLSVLGRSAARTAVIWFLVSAVTCLFFVGGAIDLISIAIMLACAAMGLWIFLRMMLQVHRKIVDKKTHEMERIRCDIERERAAMIRDPQAATRLQGMLAYEARLSAAQEWPFDQSTLVKVCASTLIVTIPWFGQAVAGYAIEHLAR